MARVRRRRSAPRGSRLVGFDPTDDARVRRLRAWLLASFVGVGLVANTQVVLGGAGQPARLDAFPIVVVQGLMLVLILWRRGRLGDRQYTLAQVAGVGVSTPLLILSLPVGSPRAAENVFLVTLVMGAVFCRTRLQAAAVGFGAIVGACVVSLHRIAEPTEAISQTLGVIVCFALIAIVIRSLRDSTEHALKAARHGEVTDPLTGTLNRRGFERSGVSLWSRAAEGGKLVALLVLDLDHFKTVNDSLGHAAGDRILQQVGAHLRAQVRGGDLAVRLGGEEFALMSTVSPGEGLVMAERIRASLAAAIAPSTVSIGVVEVAPALGDEDVLAELWKTVSTADACMYAAKQAGRDRVVGAAADGSPMLAPVEDSDSRASVNDDVVRPVEPVARQTLARAVAAWSVLVRRPGRDAERPIR